MDIYIHHGNVVYKKFWDYYSVWDYSWMSQLFIDHYNETY